MKIKQRIAFSASIVALTVGGTTLSHAATITVATYGGEWGDAIRDCITQPYTKATGNGVVPDPGVAGVTLAKLKQQAGNPSIDVAWIDGGVSELAAAAGVLDSLDPAKIPNLSKIIPEGLYKLANGSIYAVSTGFYALGLVYNTKAVQVAPTSWEDLWNPKYAGLVTIPSPDNSMGIPFLYAVNKMQGGTSADFKPGFDKLKKLNVFSYFPSAGNATNSFQASEVIIGAHYASSAWAMTDKGLPIAYVVPKEGALGGDIRLHIVKGTKHLKAAEDFVNFAIAPKQATCMSNRLYIGPATSGVSLSAEAKKRMPWGASGSIKNLVITDWQNVNSKRSAINDQWNKTLAR
ncbi:MAG: ABC transporter substrate-binding protein [Candidimonas sp.]|nr:MAG: ABC transporter substrate-binding protein [Candidimonas sp.]TAM24931.1 MAG: ABC transporter substrate-binding protein [Candidimonas sp.]TAM74037.1 MAG: ABC transporter substrate-binding protein [Candidimonas sp.]